MKKVYKYKYKTVRDNNGLDRCVTMCHAQNDKIMMGSLNCCDCLWWVATHPGDKIVTCEIENKYPRMYNSEGNRNARLKKSTK